MKKEFYSNGKLLITGEYLVLDGANAFALPTQFGQKLIVEKGSNQEIKWRSYDSDGSLWIDIQLSFENIINKKIEPESESVKNTLIEILYQAHLLQPDFFKTSEGFQITTSLTFPRNWGLGTSSTLINNLAQWMGIDAYVLLNNSFGGSGYDIACAQNNNPILYHLENGKPVIKELIFEPSFSEKLFFVYLEKKQSSKDSILAYFKNKNNNLIEDIARNNRITSAVLNANTLECFADALEEHEAEMSRILEMLTIKEALFSDFNGVIKSLGAWGGDFVMAISEEHPVAYFEERGFPTVISYKEMIM